jgi:YVTN family beta-propeller protein
MKTRDVSTLIAIAFALFTSQLFAQTVVATIPVGGSPFIVAANPRTHRVYVTNQLGHSMSVIDGSTNQVVTTVQFSGPALPFGVAVNPVTNRVYVAGGNVVAVFDGRTNTQRASVRVGLGPDRIAINTKTNRIYVTNENDGTVSVIDGASNQVVATVPIAFGLIGIGVNPNTDLIYTAPFFCNCGTVSVVDGSTNQVSTTFDVAGIQLDDVVVDPSQNRIYVTDETAGLFVVDGTDNTVLANIAGLKAPETVAVVPGMHEVVEADFGSNNAIFIDTNSFSITQKVAVGAFPNGTAVDPALRQIYVSSKGTNTVSVIAY